MIESLLDFVKLIKINEKEKNGIKIIDTLFFNFQVYYIIQSNGRYNFYSYLSVIDFSKKPNAKFSFYKISILFLARLVFNHFDKDSIRLNEIYLSSSRKYGN